MVQVLLQIEECVVEYMCHPAALQISKSDFTCQETSSIVYITYTVHLFIGQANVCILHWHFYIWQTLLFKATFSKLMVEIFIVIYGLLTDMKL